MPKTSTEKSQALRDRRVKLGQKEMRGIWVTNAEEKALKPEIRDKLREMRKGT